MKFHAARDGFLALCCYWLPPDGSNFNDDDHAYRICLIKWQWGSIAGFSFNKIIFEEFLRKKIWNHREFFLHMCKVSSDTEKKTKQK